MPRKRLDKVQSHWRVKPNTVKALSQIAQALGYTFADRGAVGKLLDAIASGEILLIPKRNS